jgi:hypothetical protein
VVHPSPTQRSLQRRADSIEPVVRKRRCDHLQAHRQPVLGRQSYGEDALALPAKLDGIVHRSFMYAGKWIIDLLADLESGDWRGW